MHCARGTAGELFEITTLEVRWAKIFTCVPVPVTCLPGWVLVVGFPAGLSPTSFHLSPSSFHVWVLVVTFSLASLPLPLICLPLLFTCVPVPVTCLPGWVLVVGFPAGLSPTSFHLSPSSFHWSPRPLPFICFPLLFICFTLSGLLVVDPYLQLKWFSNAHVNCSVFRFKHPTPRADVGRSRSLVFADVSHWLVAPSGYPRLCGRLQPWRGEWLGQLLWGLVPSGLPPSLGGDSAQGSGAMHW